MDGWLPLGSSVSSSLGFSVFLGLVFLLVSPVLPGFPGSLASHVPLRFAPSLP